MDHPSLDKLRTTGAPETRPRGRPKGPDSTVINLRIPRDLLERLNRYVDSELVWSHDSAINRATIMREALTAFLEGKGY
jgi:hypothetical protein